MDRKQLYELLELPYEVRGRLEEYENTRTQELPENSYTKLFDRTQWEEGIAKLRRFLGEDPDGIKILWEQLNIVRDFSWNEYKKRGISEDIFQATMKFCTRFLSEHHRNYGTYRYEWDWWFPRQMSLWEYRIGALEYELIEGAEREIAVHIPSDADMREASIRRSLDDFYRFRKSYLAGWEDVPLTCDSWMLMPQLQELLGENSNIVAFQKRFQIDAIDREATWYMRWIYPGHETVDESLPEQTRLQRELKKYLLTGKVFGVAKGHIVS
ncbi:MAG: acyltransferase domain-containing protein [Christensenellaceae bacterium]